MIVTTGLMMIAASHGGGSRVCYRRYPAPTHATDTTTQTATTLSDGRLDRGRLRLLGEFMRLPRRWSLKPQPPLAEAIPDTGKTLRGRGRFRGCRVSYHVTRGVRVYS